KPELDVRIDRGLAGTLGVTVGEIAQALRVAFAGVDAGDWVDPTGETRDVTVRLAPEARGRREALESLPITLPRSGGGGPGPVSVVPLGQLARISTGLGPARIDHLDRERVISVQANTQDRPLTEVMRDIQARLERITFPPGYELTLGGETADQQEVFGRIMMALAIAVMLMYF